MNFSLAAWLDRIKAGTTTDLVFEGNWPTQFLKSPMLTTSLTLTHAQILTLPTTPIQIVPGPGTGRYLVPVSCTVESNFPNGFYTVSDSSLTQGASDIVVTWGANYVNAFRAVPMEALGGSHGTKRVAFCAPFTGLSVPAAVTDLIWASAFGYPFNGTDKVENNAWYVSADNTGNFTGGAAGNTLTVTVWYQIRAYGT